MHFRVFFPSCLKWFPPRLQCSLSWLLKFLIPPQINFRSKVLLPINRLKTKVLSSNCIQFLILSLKIANFNTLLVIYRSWSKKMAFYPEKMSPFDAPQMIYLPLNIHYSILPPGGYLLRQKWVLGMCGVGFFTFQSLSKGYKNQKIPK